MSVLWFTGFEGGAALQEPFQTVTGVGCTVGVGYARTGTYGCRLNATGGASFAGHMKGCSNATGSINQGFGTDVRCHFWIKVITLPPSANTREMIWFSYRSVATGLSIALNSDGELELYVADTATPATTLLGTSSAINDGEWHAVQVKDDYTGGSPTHAYELILDDTSEISGTTSALSSNAVSVIYFGKAYQSTFDDTSYDVYIDDVAITSDAYIAYPFSIQMVVPDGPGNYVTWNRGGFGMTYNWQALDEIPPDGVTSYLFSSVSDARESVSCGSCSSVALGKAIAAIKLNYVVKRGGAGDATKFFLRDSGGTDRDTTTGVTLTAAFVAYATIWNTDPVTSVAWKASGVNASEIGMLNINPESFASQWTAGQIHILFAGLSGRNMIASDICCTV